MYIINYGSTIVKWTIAYNTFYSKDKEICSVKELENNAPKKLDIVFHDGKATIYYKLHSLTYL